MDVEKHKIYYSIGFPILFLVLLISIHSFQFYFSVDLGFLGLKPLDLQGLLGIIFMPLLHGSWSHLINNSIAWFLLSAGLIYFYSSIWKQVMIWLWLGSTAMLWLFARGDSIHIGASGLIYGLAFFHLSMSFFQRELRIMAFAMLIVFLHGSMIWGFFPEFFPRENISWQGHLTGSIMGIVLAWNYRDFAPKPTKYFEHEEAENSDFEPDYWKMENQNQDEPLK